MIVGTLRDKEIREAKEAQILKLTEELGYTESDVKKLLKNFLQNIRRQDS